jgi:hypothetical protein
MKKNSVRFFSSACFLYPASAILIIFVFTIRFFMLEKSACPSGLDGYYYALQAESLVQNGSLENPDIAPGYYLCGLCARLCGDPITGCKLWASAASALVSFAVFIFCHILFPGETVLCTVAALLSAVSPAAVQLSVNYINNETGLFFFMLYASSLIVLYRTVTGRKRSGKKIITTGTAFSAVLTVILMIAACISHLVSAAYTLLFTAILFSALIPRRFRIGGLCTAFCLGFLIFMRQLPRFRSVFAFTPVLPLFSPFMRTHLPLPLVIELSIYPVFLWFLAVMYCIRHHLIPVWLVFVPVLAFPFWNLSSLDMGYRMMLSSVPCTIIMIAFIVRQTFSFHCRPGSGLCVLSFLGCCTFFTPNLYDPRHDPPYKYYRAIAERVNLADDTLLIAHLGLNHVYTYYRKLRMALNYVPDFPYPAEKVWRLAYGVRINTVRKCFPEYDDEHFSALVSRIDGNYILIREDIWQCYLSREDPEIVELYKNWYNPHEIRPAFIRIVRNKGIAAKR